MHDTAARTDFIVSPVSSARQLRQVLRTRFDVYSVTEGMCNFGSLEGESGLDVDVYDAYAHHLALVARTGEDERVVGAMRVVSDELSPVAALLAEVVAPYRSLRARLLGDRPDALPLLSYLVQAPAVRVLTDACRASGRRFAEPSRLCIHPSARRIARRQGAHLAAEFVQAALAYGFLCMGLDQVFLDCSATAQSLYAAHGFEVIPGAEATYQPSLRTDTLAMTAHLDSVPASIRPRIEAMACELSDFGEIALCSAVQTREASVAA